MHPSLRVAAPLHRALSLGAWEASHGSAGGCFRERGTESLAGTWRCFVFLALKTMFWLEDKTGSGVSGTTVLAEEKSPLVLNRSERSINVFNVFKHPSTHSSSIHPSTHLPIHPSIHLSIHPFTHPPRDPSSHPSNPHVLIHSTAQSPTHPSPSSFAHSFIL